MLKTLQHVVLLLLGIAIPAAGAGRAEVADNPNYPRASYKIDSGGNLVITMGVYSPRGTTGITPQLTVHYDGFANGVVGMGWHLSGMGSVNRCMQSVEFGDLDYGDARPAIAGSESDRFCMGGEPLIRVGGPGYGKPNSEYRLASMPGARVQLLSGNHGLYFKTEFGNGMVSFYGNAEQSSLKNASGTKLSWMLTETQERGEAGTSVHFEYQRRINQLLLSRIRYNRSVSGDLVKDHHFLEFDYKSVRHDKNASYFAGEMIVADSRLSKITVRSKLNPRKPPSTIRTYDFTYEEATTRPVSRLQYITECHDSLADDPVCFREYTIFWTPVTSELTQDASEAGPIPGLRSQKFGDIDGDGQKELVYLSAAGENNVQTQGHLAIGLFDETRNAFTEGSPVPGIVLPDLSADGTWHLFDFNLDNKDDLLYVTRSGDQFEWRTRLSDGKTFSTASDDGIGLKAGVHPEAEVFDFDSDGLPDILTRVLIPGRDEPTWVVAYGDGIGFTEPVEAVFDASSFNFGSFDVIEVGLGRRKAADFDGNGQSDLLARIRTASQELPGQAESEVSDTQRWVAFRAGSKGRFLAMFDLGPVSSSGMPESFTQMRVADLNGDQLTDILFETPGAAGPGTWSFRLSNGISFSSAVAIPEFGGNPGQARLRNHLRVFDYDQDGNQDLVFPDGSPTGRFRVKRWRGRQFATEDELTKGRVSIGSDTNLSVFEDINGDTFIDHWRFNLDPQSSAYEVQVTSVQTPAVLQPVDRIASLVLLTTAGEDRLDVEYALLQPGSDFYQILKPEKSAAPWGTGSPVFEVHDRLWVVSRTKESPDALFLFDDGKEVSYQYRGGRYQSGGRGFIGFRQVIETDLAKDEQAKIYYHQKHPLTFHKEKVVVKKVSTGRLSEKRRYCWKERQSSWDGRIPYLAKLVTDTYSRQALFLVTKSREIELKEVDQFGNDDLTIVYSTNGKGPFDCDTHVPKDRNRIVTDWHYTYDLANWHVNRVTSVRVSQLHRLRSQNRLSEFQYDGDLLKAVRRDHNPESKYPERWEVFGRDKFGNINFKALCLDEVADADACVASQKDLATPRTNDQVKHYVRYEYDEAGRFVDAEFRLRKTESNGFEEYLSAKVLQRDIYGNATEVVDETGAPTSLSAAW